MKLKTRCYEVEDKDSRSYTITAHYVTIDGEYVCFWYDEELGHIFRNPNFVLEVPNEKDN